VKRVEIPKPDGGIRRPGISDGAGSVLFSMRSAHQAVEQAQKYIAEGCRWVVDLDLQKFFDSVNQDRLMAKIAERIGEKRMLRLDEGVSHGGCFGRRAGQSGR
jgi:RNA-directed DNA polymerase